MAQPVSDQEIAQIRRLHAAGSSANAIARELGRSPGTITRVCRRIGLTFDRSQTAAANAAAAVDFAARRAEQQREYLEIVDDYQGRLRSEYEHAQPAGAEGKVRRWKTSRPPAREAADLMRVASQATAAELRLADYKARDSHDDAREVVLQFGLAVRSAQLPDDEPADD